MDFPEPISSMLRNYDWDGYIASHNYIPVNSVEKYIPYLVVNNTGSIKVIGCIRVIYRNNNIIYDILFGLCFVINETGKLSNISPHVSKISTYGSNVYELPPEIREEMLLANSFVSKLEEFTKYRTITPPDLQILNTLVDNLIDLRRIDYLKITTSSGYLAPLIMLANNQPNTDGIIKKIIKYYTNDEIYYTTIPGETALSVADINTKKIIENAIKNNELTGFIAASNAYYRKKGKHNPITDVDLRDIFLYMGGKKSKRKRNNKRKTRKYI